MRARPFRRSDREPTITLINVVFLMLVFVLAAGRLAPARDPRLSLVEAVDPAAAPPPDGLLVLADGTLLLRGMPVTAEGAVRAGEALRIVPDRALPAARLIALGRDLRDAGATALVIVAERASP